MGTQNLWILKICGYIKFKFVVLTFLKIHVRWFSKFVGNKICEYSNFVMEQVDSGENQDILYEQKNICAFSIYILFATCAKNIHWVPYTQVRTHDFN